MGAIFRGCERSCGISDNKIVTNHLRLNTVTQARADRSIIAQTTGIRSTAGQATIEYAVLLLGFIAMITALALFWHLAQDGFFIAEMRDVASHEVPHSNTSRSWISLVQDLSAF